MGQFAQHRHHGEAMVMKICPWATKCEQLNCWRIADYFYGYVTVVSRDG
jgi:hypothetical protein